MRQSLKNRVREKEKKINVASEPLIKVPDSVSSKSDSIIIKFLIEKKDGNEKKSGKRQINSFSHHWISIRLFDGAASAILGCCTFITIFYHHRFLGNETIVLVVSNRRAELDRMNIFQQ